MVYYNQYFSRVVFIPNKSPNQPVVFSLKLRSPAFLPKKVVPAENSRSFQIQSNKKIKNSNP